MTNILTVDDSRVCLKMVDRILTRAGHGVVTTQNPSEVSELIKAYSFDMVLIDIVMPQKDGWQLLAELRAMPQMHRLPIIMLSGIADAATRTRGIRAGADDFIVKPFDPEELEARVDALLARYRHPLGQLSGVFDSTSLSQLLINVGESEASGTLHILTDRMAGQVLIHRGVLVDARFGERQGLAAMETILDIPNGLHQFIPCENVSDASKRMHCPMATVIVGYRDLVKQH